MRILTTSFLFVSALSLFAGCAVAPEGDPVEPAAAAPDGEENVASTSAALNPGCRDMQIGWPAYSLDQYGRPTNNWFGPIIWSAEDRVEFSYSAFGAAPSDSVRVCLGSAPAITWWKGIEAFDANGNKINPSVETQDGNHGANCFTVRVNDRGGEMALKFLKAKIFGIHTGMYCVQNLAPWAGRTLNFTWNRDS